MTHIEIEKTFLDAIKGAVRFNPNIEPKMYRVGGYVRDSFLGIKSKDVDYVVTNVRFEHLKDALLNITDKVISTEVGDSMNVIKVPLGDGEPYDFAIPRKDIYGNSGNHTDLITIGDPSMSVEDDLSRRDCCLNAIAQDVETNEIIDPFNGIKDINYGIIRAVGNPKDRFIEDALRMLRVIQFSVRFDFPIEAETFKAIKDNVFLLKNITGERIDGELVKAFIKSKDSSNISITTLLNSTNVGVFLFGEKFLPAITRNIVGDSVLSNYALMFSYGGNYDRLKLSSKVIDCIVFGVKYIDFIKGNVDLLDVVYKKTHYRKEFIDIIKSFNFLMCKEHVEFLNLPIDPKELNIETQWMMDQGVIGKNISTLHKKMLKLIWEMN